MSASLPSDAFAFYVALGDDRSYQAVADHFGVGKTSVVNRAKKENWQGRLDVISKDIHAAALANANAALASDRQARTDQKRRMHEAIADVMTPDRIKAVIASLLKAAVQGSDIGAARLLLDRTLGRPRNEPLGTQTLAFEGGLRTSTDVRAAADSILAAVASGALSPEDGQRAATVVEAARRAVETEDLERRLAELEQVHSEQRR